MRVVDAMMSLVKRLLGTSNEAVLRSYRPLVAEVCSRETELQQLDDTDLRQRGAELLQRARDESPGVDAIRVEALALVREVADRQLGMWNAIRAPHPEWKDDWWGDARQAVDEARQRLGEDKDSWTIDLPAAVYARIREQFPISVPPFRMRAHDVQLIGAAVLDSGRIAEQKTGEGKTLAAVFASYVNALVGTNVHIVTVNDYLASRDATENAPVYRFLGLSVGAIHPQMPQDERKAVYAMDVTYGTTSEFGFDYLRDNLKQRLEDQVQTVREFAIVDEVDSVLIDEARVPLIISGPAQGREEFYASADEVARQLEVDKDFEVDIKDRTINLSEEGIEKATELFGVKSMYDAEGMHLPHFLENALRAHHLFHRDKEYMVVGGEVQIVDENTGRVLHGRRWSEGLHQAIETKEGVNVQPETQTYATVTLQNFFRLYDKLAGMTGTAMTEADEFNTIYKLQPVAIPPNRSVVRADLPDLIYGTEQEKFDAIVDEVEELHGIGQPVLIGTITVEASERMSELFKRKGIKHNVLNAKQHAREADIIKNAGQIGAVTISTNMAGRGTDIKLGKGGFRDLLGHWRSQGFAPRKIKEEDPQLDEAVVDLWSKKFLGDEEAEKYRGQDPADVLVVVNKARRQRGWPSLPLPSEMRAGADCRQLGGLRIIGTERHDSRRIDNQLRGRSGRQGDPGSSRFYLSLEDSLMKRFAGPAMANLMRNMGLRDGIPIESKMVSRSVEKAQKRVEEYNFGIRKNLLEYDQVMNIQRKNIYQQRQEILQGKDLEVSFLDVVEKAMDDLVQEAAADGTRGDTLATRLSEQFNAFIGLPAPAPSEVPVQNGGDACCVFLVGRIKEALVERGKELEAVKSDFEERGERLPIDLPGMYRFVLLEAIDRRWKDHIDFMDHLRRGITLESYGQKDPKMRFKEEGFKSFQAMSQLIRNDVSRTFFRLQLQIEDGPRRNPPPPRRGPRGSLEAGGFRPVGAAGSATPQPAPVGADGEPDPDAPCPCGSGQSYRRCHGKM